MPVKTTVIRTPLMAGSFFVDNTWTGSVAHAGNPANGMGFYIAHIQVIIKMSQCETCAEIFRLVRETRLLPYL